MKPKHIDLSVKGTNGIYFPVHRNIAYLFGDHESAIMISILVNLHNNLLKKPNYDGWMYYTHAQFQKEDALLKPSVITNRLEKIANTELMERRVDEKTKRNLFKLNESTIERLVKGESYEEIINSRKSRINNSRKSSDKVNINKDKINIRKELSSKEERAHASHGAKIFKLKKRTISDIKKNPAPVPKLKKSDSSDSLNQNMSSNPSKRKEYKQKHIHHTGILSVYNHLVSLGAVRHNPSSVSYLKTLDSIYELLNHQKHIPPYCKSKHNIPDDYRVKEWTEEEFIDSFEYYITHDENKTYRNIHSFILAEMFNEKSWSPLIKSHKMMLAAKGLEYDGDEKRLFKELERLGCEKELQPREIKKIIRLLDIYCVDYKVNENLNHLYYGRLIYAFGQFISEKIRQASFKVCFLQSEKVMQEFVHEFENRGVLIRNGY